MTISTTESSIAYNGNGVTLAFAVPFRFLVDADIVATRRNAAGIESTLVLNTDYTLTGANNDAGGTLTMVVAPAVGERLVIDRVVGVTQETDYPEGGNFPAEAHERALDRLTMIDQQLLRSVSRCLQLPISDTASPILPASTVRANTVFAFDAQGNYAPYIPSQNTAPELAQRIGRLHVSVMDEPWGATGNGLTDDTAAVQAAIDYAETIAPYGATVFFPAGTYKLSTITVNSSGITLQGAGSVSSRLEFINASGDSIQLQGLSAPGVYNCQINDLTIEHPVAKTSGYAIAMYRANQCQVQRCLINNCWNGVDARVINNVAVRDCVIAQVKGAVGIHFRAPTTGLERSDVLTISDTAIQCNYNGSDCIVWEGFAHTLRIHQVAALSGRYALWVKPSPPTNQFYPSFLFANDLEIDGASNRAVYIQAGASMWFSNCALENTSGSPSQGGADNEAVRIEADINGSFTQNIFMSNCRIGNTGNGDALWLDGRNVQITNSTFHSAGKNAANTKDAIVLAANAQDILINNCFVGRHWGTPLICRYGIRIENGVFRTHIGSNSYFGCQTGNILDQSTSGNVVIERGIDRNGNPRAMQRSFMHQRDADSATEISVVNGNTTVNSSARLQLSTGTANSFYINGIRYNGANPEHIESVGSGVALGMVKQANTIQFFNLAINPMFAIGVLLPNAANDAAAAALNVPVGGYYRNGGAVLQRQT